MCDKAIGNFLPALEFVPDWFLTAKMIEKLHGTLFTDDNILFFMKILVITHFLMMKWVY